MILVSNPFTDTGREGGRQREGDGGRDEERECAVDSRRILERNVSY